MDEGRETFSREKWFSRELTSSEESCDAIFEALESKAIRGLPADDDGMRRLPIGKNIYSMAILNVTPDSFSDGGLHYGREKALKAVEKMIEAGVDIIDVGGESTRPGSRIVPADEELERIIPVIEGIRALSSTVYISVDTYKASVALKAAEAGADIINDIYALQADPEMANVVAKTGKAVILMNHPAYYRPHFEPSKVFPKRKLLRQPAEAEIAMYAQLDILSAQRMFLNKSLRIAHEAGVSFKNIILDPGIGFGMTQRENLLLIDSLDDLKKSGLPVLLAPSRKRYVKTALAGEPALIEAGTAASLVYGVARGADILRFHDFETHIPVMLMAAQLRFGPEARVELSPSLKRSACLQPKDAVTEAGAVNGASAKSAAGAVNGASAKSAALDKAEVSDFSWGLKNKLRELLSPSKAHCDELQMQGMQFFSHIGVFPEEKEKGANFKLDLSLFYVTNDAAFNDCHDDALDYSKVMDFLKRYFAQAKDDLLEHAAENLAKALFENFSLLRKLKIRLQKPEAPLDATFDTVAVNIERSRKYTTYLSLGSNIGERKENLKKAYDELSKLDGLEITDQSSIYETKPWGVEDQADFLNMVIEAESSLSIPELIKALKEIEAKMGREDRGKWRERVIDIDILACEGISHESETLKVPHQYASVRDFVLFPLAEIISGEIWESDEVKFLENFSGSCL